MARCDQCGNDYDKAFRVNLGDETYTFDSFECAIQELAPICPYCGNYPLNRAAAVCCQAQSQDAVTLVHRGIFANPLINFWLQIAFRTRACLPHRLCGSTASSRTRDADLASGFSFQIFDLNTSIYCEKILILCKASLAKQGVLAH